MREELSRTRHPVQRRYLALAIGRRSLPQIIGLYLAATAALSALLGLLLSLVSRRDVSFATAFRDSLSNIFNPGDILSTDGESPAYYLVAGVVTCIGVLLPVFLLGAFVFKLFQFDPVTWRRKISIESTWRHKRAILTIRFYNNSSTILLKNSIQVIARVRSAGKPQIVNNVAMKVVRDGTEQEILEWPYSRPGAPFTIWVPLGDGIDAHDVSQGDLMCVPGYEVAIKKDRVSFLIVLSGVVKDTGNNYFSTIEYPASDIEYGHFQEIDADYTVDPKVWPGWDRFDENREMYVFGYGSLVSPESVAQTLGHDVDRTQILRAHLAGWERRWNVGSDKDSHPERTFYLREGSGQGDPFHGVTVVLGIQPTAKTTGCNGAVFPVLRADLNLLDVRERNYERVDVTDQVTWAGKPEYCVVYTYVPKAEAKAKVVRARETGKPMNVRREYVDLVERAFTSVDELTMYRDTTPDPSDDMPIVSMESVIRKDAAPIAATAMASYFADDEPSSLNTKDIATAGDETVIPSQADATELSVLDRDD